MMLMWKKRNPVVWFIFSPTQLCRKRGVRVNRGLRERGNYKHFELAWGCSQCPRDFLKFHRWTLFISFELVDELFYIYFISKDIKSVCHYFLPEIKQCNVRPCHKDQDFQASSAYLFCCSTSYSHMLLLFLLNRTYCSFSILVVHMAS